MNNELLYILLVVLIGIIIYFLLSRRAKNMVTTKQEPYKDPQHSLPLRLQAYERLTLLSDRMAIPNLVQRMVNSNMSAKLLQQEMVQNIRQEFEHNITQQIYVSRNAWNAVTHLKEQNIMLLHQIAGKMPETANGLMYCQTVLEHLANHPEASLYESTTEMLASEAQKLM